MTFVAILVALLLEQARPLGHDNPIHKVVRGWVAWAGRNFDAGRPQHGNLTWSVAVLAPAAGAMFIYWLLLETVGWPVAVLWNIAMLYVTLGFRQFSHHFTDIRNALEVGDEERAHQLLADWQQGDVRSVPRSQLVRQVIEYSVVAAHRHVFGVLAWYSVLAAMGLGPAGAVLYRLSEFVPRYWARRDRLLVQPVSDALQAVAARAWRATDWLPARVTAAAFAVVGSFEDAIESWRNYELRGPGDSNGVIIAATAGAVNVNLGAPAASDVQSAGEGSADETTAAAASGATLGQQPVVGHLRTIVGLVWRTVVMWMILLALLTLARLLG